MGHATRPKQLPRSVLETLRGVGADVLIFSEFVDQKFSEETRRSLGDFGYLNSMVSDVCEYSPGRWHNQILVASAFELKSRRTYTNGPDALGATNTLSFEVLGLDVTGLRIPMYRTSREWNAYWDWIDDCVFGDIVIGDVNCDPQRGNRRDSRLTRFVELRDAELVTGDNPPSYVGKNGTFSTVDHAVMRRGIFVHSASYIRDGIVPDYTDHAAMIVRVGS